MCPFLLLKITYLKSFSRLSNVSSHDGNERMEKMYREAEEYNENVQLKIGQRIQEKRIEKGIAGVDMAVYLDITANSYSRIERGEVKCDIPKLFVICQMLDISADYILFGRVSNNAALTQEQIDAIRVMKKAFE